MRYQYKGNFSKGGHFGPQLFTDAIKLLISINFIIFILQTISDKSSFIFRFFGIVPINTWNDLMIWQPFTYLFIHGDIWHVLINMFVLWMFGSELEMTWGRKDFLKYYFSTGLGAGIVTILFNLTSNTPIVGASGAVFGILLAYGLMFPNRLVYIYFLIPVKVKYFVLVIGVVALFSSFGQSNISHITHLSGMIIGFIYLRSNARIDTIKNIVSQKKAQIEEKLQSKKQERLKELQIEVDKILDKINLEGFGKLTEEEKSFLYNASQKLANKDEKN